MTSLYLFSWKELAQAAEKLLGRSISTRTLKRWSDERLSLPLGKHSSSKSGRIFIELKALEEWIKIVRVYPVEK